MDVLANVLSVTRLGAAAIAHAELVPPWGLEIDPVAEAHVHVVQQGSCWLRTTEEREFRRLDAGDVVLIRSGVGHSICDSPDTPPAPYKQALDAMAQRVAQLPTLRPQPTTIVLCAKYLFQAVGPHPIAALLPPLVHLPSTQAAHHPQLQLVVELLRHEALAAPSGTELVVPRLVDSLLVYVIRAWFEQQPAEAAGWFGALRDPAIAKALGLIHAQPEATWSVADLARLVGQSRATFARRFRELVGESPVAYQTRWRMCVATKLLAETDLSLDEIAPRIGYETAAAFSKAFRRCLTTTPGQFRTSARLASAAGSRDARTSR